MLPTITISTNQCPTTASVFLFAIWFISATVFPMYRVWKWWKHTEDIPLPYIKKRRKSRRFITAWQSWLHLPCRLQRKQRTWQYSQKYNSKMAISETLYREYSKQKHEINNWYFSKGILDGFPFILLYSVCKYFVFVLQIFGK